MMWLKRDRVVGECLRLYGEFAPSEVALLRSLVKEGDTVVDAGAHVGAIAVPLALKVGAAGRVLAFEPQRLSHACLAANFVMNGLEQAVAVRAALGAAPRRLRAAQGRAHEEGNWGAVALVEDPDGEEIELQALDGLRLPQLALLKMDVEGMEIEVLRGAQDTLARLRPAVYFEAKKGEGTKQCFALLRAAGYQLWWHFALFVGKESWRGTVENPFPATGDANVLALPAERAARPALPPVEGDSDDFAAAYDKAAGR